MGKTHVIYEVVYPDERRGPQGVSTALFRCLGSAKDFAARNRGRVDEQVVTPEELKALYDKSKL